jgi:hypothetical protein
MCGGGGDVGKEGNFGVNLDNITQFWSIMGDI